MLQILLFLVGLTESVTCIIPLVLSVMLFSCRLLGYMSALFRTTITPAVFLMIKIVPDNSSVMFEATRCADALKSLGL